MLYDSHPYIKLIIHIVYTLCSWWGLAKPPSHSVAHPATQGPTTQKGSCTQLNPLLLLAWMHPSPFYSYLCRTMMHICDRADTMIGEVISSHHCHSIHLWPGGTESWWAHTPGECKRLRERQGHYLWRLVQDISPIQNTQIPTTCECWSLLYKVAQCLNTT